MNNKMILGKYKTQDVKIYETKENGVVKYIVEFQNGSSITCTTNNPHITFNEQ